MMWTRSRHPGFAARHRIESGPLFTITHFNRVLYSGEYLGSVLLEDSGALDQKDKWCRTSIHDRHFSCADIDQAVIDAETCKSGHQMLDGRDLDAVLLQRGGEFGLCDVERVCFDQGHRRTVGTTENNAGVDRCGIQGQEDLLARMQTYTGGPDGVLQSSLSYHWLILMILRMAATMRAAPANPEPNSSQIRFRLECNPAQSGTILLARSRPAPVRTLGEMLAD